MAEHVCPWWLGYTLILPLRRLWQNPHNLLAPYVREGMTVLEPGPGMGFFTLELARMVGPEGRVIAVDVQPKMLEALAKRARKAGLSGQIILHPVKSESMALTQFTGQVDVVLAFYVVHEFPSAGQFFAEAAAALKPGGKLLLVEPAGHVNSAKWAEQLQAAHNAGLHEEQNLKIAHSHAVVLSKGFAA